MPSCKKEPLRSGAAAAAAACRGAPGPSAVAAALRPINIFFGSQTGKAEMFAKLLARRARRRGYAAAVIDLQRFDGAMLEPSAGVAAPPAVFLLATYGEGEPTDNARAFCRWLKDAVKKSRHLAPLEGLRVAVFGLGDRRYEQFNVVATRVHKQLGQLGALSLMDVGLGDDAQDLNADFAAWCSAFWDALTLQDPDTSTLTECAGREEEAEEATLLVRLFASKADAFAALRGAHATSSSMLDAAATYTVEVTENKQLHRAGPRSCRHVEVRSEGVWEGGGSKGVEEAPVQARTRLEWETGDHVAVHPRNPPELVERLLARVDLPQVAHSSTNAWLVVTEEGGGAPFPCPTTVREAFERYLDICGPPPPAVLGALAAESQDRAKRMHLRHLRDNAQARKQRLTQMRKNVVHVLEEFDLRISLRALVTALPRLRPRYYSISSSSAATPDTLAITAVVLREGPPASLPPRAADAKTQTQREACAGDAGEEFEGVCTGYLARQRAGAWLSISVRRSSFKLPASLDTPIILVGAGTGIAPLRGFYLERLHLRQRLDGGRGGSSGERAMVESRDVLFYGCRRPGEDDLYAEELAQVVRAGGLAHVITAFSRQGAEKVYVQDRLRQGSNASLVASLIAAGACVYVCGGTGMAMEVKRAFTAALEQSGVPDAAEKVQQLQSCGRYLQDVWG